MATEPGRPLKPLPPASNRKARVIVYGLIVAITGAMTATAIITAIRVDTSHPPRTRPSATAGHKHTVPAPQRAHHGGAGGGAKVLFIAAAQSIPRLPQDLGDISRAQPPAQPSEPARHGQNGRRHGPQNDGHKGKR